ncbi:MAG: LamG-like jellyroll fold domain-containing protein, partial [Nitrososphaerota archaeon]
HDGHAKIDCGDIRVIFENKEVPCKVSAINNTHARIFFYADLPALSSNIYYVYYGNPSAVFPNYLIQFWLPYDTFYDDFENNKFTLSSWDQNLGSWTLLYGYYKTKVGVFDNAISTVKDLMVYDCIIETKLKFQNGEVGFRAGIVFRYGDKGHYALEISDEYNVVQFSYYPSTDINYGTNLGYKSYPINTENEYSLRLEVIGNTLKGYINGIEILSISNDNLTFGKVGLRARRSDVSFDYFKVTILPTSKNQPVLVIGNEVSSSAVTSYVTPALYPTGLVGYWRFDEGKGLIAYDSSGNNNHGALINGPTWVDGKYGSAIALDGIDDYVVVQDSPLLRVQSFSICVWIYMTKRPYQHSPDVHCAMINKLHYIGPAAYGYKMDFEAPTATDDTLVVSIGTGSQQVFLIRYNSINDLTLYKWHHLAATYDGNIAKLYIDGQLKATSGPMRYKISHDSTPLTFGHEYSVPRMDVFQGLMDDVMIFNRALTNDEIISIYYSSPSHITVDRSFVSDNRADVGSTQSFGFHAKWSDSNLDVVNGSILVEQKVIKTSYDPKSRTIFETLISTSTNEYVTNGSGWINFNFSSPFVGKTVFKIVPIAYDPNTGMTTIFNSLVEDITIIWDRVNVTLNIKSSRINVGFYAEINSYATYEYDGTLFTGTIILNDTNFTQDFVGKKTFKTQGIIDSTYGLSSFTTNEVSCIFDRVKYENKIENPSFGTILALSNLNYEFDNQPVTNAKLKINGISAQNMGNGLYRATLYSYMPFITINIQFDVPNFESMTISFIQIAWINLILIIIIIVGLTFLIILLYRRHVESKKKTSLKNLVKEKGRVNFEDASKILGLTVQSISTLTSKLIEDREIYGIILRQKQEFVSEEFLCDLIEQLGRFKFEDLSAQLGEPLTNFEIKNIINNLISRGKIKGTFTADGNGFVTEERLTKELGGE